MMRFLGVAIMVVALAACSSKNADNPGKPKNFIAADKMKLVLFDVLSAQEYAKIKYGNDTVAVNTNTAIMLLQVFSIHQVSKDAFYDSFRYYEAHPDMSEALFDSLSAYTNQKKQDMYNRLR